MIITRAMPTQQTAITGVSRRITAGQEIKAELCRGPGTAMRPSPASLMTSATPVRFSGVWVPVRRANSTRKNNCPGPKSLDQGPYVSGAPLPAWLQWPYRRDVPLACEGGYSASLRGGNWSGLNELDACARSPAAVTAATRRGSPSMSTPPPTIAGRSPFDHIRFRWGGAGSIALGVAIMFTGAGAGIVFGILLVLLGIATWIFTKFGETSWYDMSAAGKVIAGTGSVIGL